MPPDCSPAMTHANAMSFCLATEHSPIGTAIIGLDGRWLNVNPAMCDLLGYTKDEFPGLTFQQVTDPADLETDLALVDDLLAGRIASYQLDKRYVRKDGSRVWARLSVSLVRDAAGAPMVFISHVQDISAEKADAIERDRLTERASLAARAAGIGFWEWDLKTNALSWSPEMFDLFRVEDTGEPITFAFFALGVHEDDREPLNRAIKAATRSGVLDSEFRIRCLDGDVREIKVLGRLYRGIDGASDRMIGANWDVTETRALTLKAEAASRTKSQFLAVMSHEIRTPMNGILGMAQAMRGDDLIPAQHDRLKVISECGQGLLTILNDVLDLSKVEAGKLELEQVPFDLSRVLNGIAAAHALNIEERGLHLRLDMEAACGIYLGDPTRLRQIVCNLVSNAMKFTEQGEISIKARRSGGGLRIEVADTGRGMDQTTLSAIFDPFAQADASTTRRFGGTGLGLSIVRQLAVLMGGDVAVASRLGYGSRFTVTLPIERLGDASDEREVEPVPPSPAPNLRVLAAEDNATNRLVLKTLLAQFDIAVTLVLDGAQAVEAYRADEWDVILMDVQMPVLDGLSATRAIRAIEAAEGRRRTPILALTANAMSHHKLECLKAGMDDLVAKPVDIRGLLAAMEMVCTDQADNDADAPPSLAAG